MGKADYLGLTFFRRPSDYTANSCLTSSPPQVFSTNLSSYPNTRQALSTPRSIASNHLHPCIMPGLNNCFVLHDFAADMALPVFVGRVRFIRAFKRLIRAYTCYHQNYGYHTAGRVENVIRWPFCCRLCNFKAPLWFRRAPGIKDFV